MSIKTALLILFSLIGGYTNAFAQERIGTNAMDGFSGFWVGDRDTCKNGIPTGERWIVGKFTYEKENVIWGNGGFKIENDTEFGCMLRQPKRLGNELSFKTQCEYDGKRIPSEVKLQLGSPNEMDIKIINKQDSITHHVYRCGAAK
jgi:hypothetical protein